MKQMKRYISVMLAAMLILQGTLAFTVSAKPAGSVKEVSILATGPNVVSFSPTSGTEGVQLSSSFSINFSENVTAGAGKITIHQASTNAEVVAIPAAQASITQSLVQFNVNGLQANTNYYILVSADAFQGTSGAYVGIQSGAQWRFKTAADVDTNPLLLTGSSPLNNAVGVPVTTPITLTFNKPVFANQGSITIETEYGVQLTSVPVTDSRVTGSGTNTIMLNGPFSLPNQTGIHVVVPAWAFVDAGGKGSAEIVKGQWKFKTVSANNTPPTVVSYVPQRLAGGVSVNPTLSLEFNEDIFKNQGNVYIKRLKDNVAKTISVNDVAISGRTAKINVTGLDANTEYYVLIDSGAFMDSDNTPFAGIQTSSTWQFTTEAGQNQAPVTFTSLLPANNATGVAVRPTLKLTFNKPVYPGVGNITIYNGSNPVMTFGASSTNVTGGGSDTIQINLSTDLQDNQNYSVKVDAGAFRDIYGNSFNGISTSQWNFRVTKDTGVPAIAYVYPTDTSKNVPLATEITMTMNKEVQLGTGSITLKRNGYGTTADVVVDPNNKRVVRIKPRSALVGGSTYTVDVGRGAVKDLAGNDYPGMTNAWSFTTLVPDTVPPTLESVVMLKSDVVELSYNKDLDSSSVPMSTNFKLTVNGEDRPLMSTYVFGKKVQVYLQSGIAIGQDIRLSYTQGTAPLKDINGNRAASFSNREVTNKVENSMSKITNAVATGSIIQLTFNDSLKDIDSKGISQFNVSIDGVVRQPVNIVGSGSLVTLTLNQGITDGQVVTLQYQPGAYPLKDRYDGTLTGFGPIYIRNGMDTKPPVLVSTLVEGTRLILNYNEGINPDNLPMKSHYSVLVNDKARYVNKVEVRNNQVILTLASAVSSKNDAVTLSYVPGYPRITDLSNNQAAAFSLLTVGNVTDSSYPQVDKATITNDLITLTFNKQLDNQSVPSSSYFSVRVGNQIRSIRSVQVNNSIVTLTLSSAAASTETVVVTYTAPYSNGLMDLNGSKVRSFSNMTATNTTTGGNNNNGGTGTVPQYTQEASWNLFLKDMLLVNTAAATKTTDRTQSGQYVNRYNVNDAQWKGVLDYATRNGRQVVALDLAESEKAAIVAIPVKALEDMSRTDKDLEIGVRYGNWLYTIALQNIPYSEIGRQLNGTASNATLLFQIEQQPSQQSTYLATAIRNEAGAAITEPYQFNLSAFTSYPAARATPVVAKTNVSNRLTSAVTAAQISAVRVDVGTGAGLAYVPTKVKSESGVSVTNSILNANGAIAIARSTRSFSDVGSHWAASDINALAGRFVATARQNGKFEPNKAITREEFAVFIAKGIGLDGNLEAAKRFRDVSGTSTAAPYIGAAVKAGIITGNVDGTFKPGSPITREQMALMMNRAMTHTGNSVKLSQSASQWMSKFKDRKQINTSSQDAVAKMLEVGIIQGMTKDTFGPRDQATRAQASVMIKRMMQKIDFM
ncbi:Ig-like domain-containing protein [Paenibacillus taiwanensis]|uniref:Ig-like domain-containing protein n=1 Tax=Paenibacillus taiwanensis TaxID=401638 RepID=UPI0004240051|nr:Ig-like domain-containing protein [Paenibacillus taiwanensis]